MNSPVSTTAVYQKKITLFYRAYWTSTQQIRNLVLRSEYSNPLYFKKDSSDFICSCAVSFQTKLTSAKSPKPFKTSTHLLTYQTFLSPNELSAHKQSFKVYRAVTHLGCHVHTPFSSYSITALLSIRLKDTLGNCILYLSPSLQRVNG